MRLRDVGVATSRVRVGVAPRASRILANTPGRRESTHPQGPTSACPRARCGVLRGPAEPGAHT